MSRIYIASDLHLEFADFTVPTKNIDIVILAGDIHSGTEGLSWAREMFPEQEIIYVAGNHEFYHHQYETLLSEFYHQAQKLQIHFLENDQCIIQGIRFLGCTLWTDYQCYAEHSQSQSMQLLGNSLADHKLIKYAHETSLFTPENALTLHQNSKRWLEHHLTTSYPGTTMVITHHGPSLACKHKFFGHSELAPGFYSDLTALLQQSEYWIYGHTHSNLDIQIGSTRLIANQRGYPNERIDSFNNTFILDI